MVQRYGIPKTNKLFATEQIDCGEFLVYEMPDQVGHDGVGVWHDVNSSTDRAFWWTEGGWDSAQ